jgi:hypothetical protein
MHHKITPTQAAAAIGRICRYAGRGAAFFSVLLHSFVVADLVAVPLRLKALGHDVPEMITGDYNSTFKTDEIRRAEWDLQHEIFDDLGIPRMTKKEHDLIKVADNRSRAGEVWTVGDRALRKKYPFRDREAEQLTLKYHRKFPPSDTINPTGRAVKEFVRRFKIYKKLAKQ